MPTDPTEFTTFGGFTDLIAAIHRMKPGPTRGRLMEDAYKRMQGIALYQWRKTIAEVERKVDNHYPEYEARPKRGVPYSDERMNEMTRDERKQFLFERAVQRAKDHNASIPRGGKLMSVPQSPPSNVKEKVKKLTIKFKELPDEEFEKLTPKQALEYHKRKMRAIQSGGGEDHEYPSHGRADFCHETTLNNGRAMKETYDLRRQLYADHCRRVALAHLRRDLGPWGVNPAHSRWPACFSTCVDFWGVIYSNFGFVATPGHGPRFNIDPLAIGTVPISSLSDVDARLLTTDIWASMKKRHGKLSQQRVRIMDTLAIALYDWSQYMTCDQSPRTFSIPITKELTNGSQAVIPANLKIENCLTSMHKFREKFTGIKSDEWTVPWPRNSNGSRASDEEIADFRFNFIDDAKHKVIKITPKKIEPWSVEDACLEMIRRNTLIKEGQPEHLPRSLIDYFTSGGCPDALDELMSQDVVALEITDHPA